jgi:hypothetical protein
MARTKGQLISPIGILTAIGVNISGVATASSFVGTNFNVSGISTLGTTSITQLNVSGIATATNLSGTFVNYTEKINELGNTGTASTINLSNGSFVTATLNSNTTFTFNVGITTGASSFALFLTNDSTPGRTITWPISVVWPGGTVPTRTTTANKTDVYTFFTLNNGSTWYGNIAQYNY